MLALATPCPATPAHVTSYATPALTAAAVRINMLKGSIVLSVTLDAQGNPSVVKLLESSGDHTIDSAALDEARELSYAPQTQDCRAIGGVYETRITFVLHPGDDARLDARVQMSGTGCAADHPVLLTRTAAIPLPQVRVTHGALPPSVDAIVDVNVDSDGRVLDATLKQSSGSPRLDQYALAEAQKSQYAPAESACRTSGGIYVMDVSARHQ